MAELPILLSIPHAGTRIPPELDGRVSLSPLQLLYASDAFADRIYDLGVDVAAVVKTDVARACVDMNRSPLARFPAVVDGVVKRVTANDRPIYHPGREPGEALTDALIARYAEPYHAAIMQALRRPGLQIALDCHSMARSGLARQRDHGQPRPSFCLSSRFGASAPDDLLHALGDALRDAFGLPETEIGYHRPFAGGYITSRYGRGALPWIQVELNRQLYVRPPWFDKESRTMDPRRLAELRDAFRAALRALRL